MSNGQGNDARIVYKRLRLSCSILLNVTVPELRNGLRNRNLNPKIWFIPRLSFISLPLPAPFSLQGFAHSQVD